MGEKGWTEQESVLYLFNPESPESFITHKIWTWELIYWASVMLQILVLIQYQVNTGPLLSIQF